MHICERQYMEIVDAKIKRKIFCKLRDEASGFEGALSTNVIPSSLDQINDISGRTKNKTDELLKILNIATSQRNSPDAYT